jgi:hypothetical protein
LAKDYLNRLTQALEEGDGPTLADIVFDAEQEEDLADHLDLDWYE